MEWVIVIELVLLALVGFLVAPNVNQIVVNLESVRFEVSELKKRSKAWSRPSCGLNVDIQNSCH